VGKTKGNVELAKKITICSLLNPIFWMDLGLLLIAICILICYLFLSFFQIWLLSKSPAIADCTYIPILFFLAVVLLRATMSRFFSVGCHALISAH
jgi:hypothetical protein